MSSLNWKNYNRYVQQMSCLKCNKDKMTQRVVIFVDISVVIKLEVDVNEPPPVNF